MRSLFAHKKRKTKKDKISDLNKISSRIYMKPGSEQEKVYLSGK